MYNVGDTFLCIKDFFMKSGELAYTKGKYYKSEYDGCITDNSNFKNHVMGKVSIKEHFLTKEEVRDLKIRELIQDK